MTASATVHAERLPIKVYTTADGLAHNTVNRIVRDSRGFLWFCTDDGLSRFDGYTFRTFGTEHGLPHSSVTDFLETKGGELWVATKGGLVQFDPKGTPHNRPHPPAAQPARPMFLEVSTDRAYAGAAHVTVLHQARDAAIWVGTYNGLYRLEGSEGHRSLRRINVGMPDAFPEQSEVTDILEDSRGALWVAALSGLYRRWADGSAARYTERDGLPSMALTDLFEDRKGQLWAGTIGAGFFGFAAGPESSAPVVTSAYNLSDGLATYWVSRLFETSNGRFWIATPNGLSEFFSAAHPPARRFRSYGSGNGLTDFQIAAVAEDLAGNLWMGTGSAGAMKVTHDGFTTYGELDAVRSVYAILEDAGSQTCFRGTVFGDRVKSVSEGAVLSMFAGPDERYAHGRFGCFDGSGITWFYPSAVTNFGWVSEGTTLRTRAGEWWIGTGEGIYRYAPVSRMNDLASARPMAVYSTKDGLPAPQVYRLFEDSRGDVWVSTTSGPSQGLARWDHASGRLHDLTHSPNVPSLTDNTARVFGEDRAGSIWIGFNRGLARYKDGRFTLFSTAGGLPPGQVRDIHLDRRGRLWLASGQSGLIRVEDDGERVTFVSYTTAQGLSSSNTTAIAEDSEGRIFVGSGRGLDRLDPGSGQVRHFTTADGLASGVLRAALGTRGGALWFGTTQGLSRLVPASTDVTRSPPILIDEVRVRGVLQRVSVLGERELSLDRLSPQQNQLQIDFVGLSFEPGDTLRYHYKLGDSEWSPLAPERSVTFASLPPGRYTFLVRAANSEGVMSLEPAAVTFTILSPIWLRWWFLMLLGTAAAATIHGLYRYRLSRLLEMANMRTRIATDLHDDIGANLTRIALLSEVAEQAARRERRATAGDAPVDEDGVLESIARIARESVASMSDIVWAINPKRETLVDLVRRMRQHADELFTAREVDLRFDAPPSAHNPRLGVDVRRDVLLIFKEAVSNAAKHSRCSRVSIHLSCDGSNLTLQVTDDGVGFDPASEHGDGQGCPSMRRRAGNLKARLQIVSTTGRGTTISLVTPI